MQTDRHAIDLRIGGFTPFSGIDYPDHLSALVFCQGCPWRCRYCHNTELLDAQASQSIDWADIIEFLHRRRRLLDAVVFSGGEPCLQAALKPALEAVRRLGYKTALHSAGIYPRRLQALFPLLDWVGLDIKAMPADYAHTTGVAGSGASAWESARLLQASGLAYEVRITVHPDLLPPAQLARLIDRLKAMGVTNILLQPCRGEQMLDQGLSTHTANYLLTGHSSWHGAYIRPP